MPNVLVVDDSSVDRVLVEGLLKKGLGFQVVSVTNGAKALEHIASTPVDVVVTDLQMPEMDGLQLVTNLRIQYPHVPVVLITAHGSEDLAMRALEQGASSYVAKAQLKDRIVETVQQVLSHAQADRSYTLLTERMDFADLRFTLEDDHAIIERFVELVQQISVSMGICDIGGQVRFGMALEEALSFLMLRGNYELSEEDLQHVHMHDADGTNILQRRRSQAPYNERKLRISCRIAHDGAVITIGHEGPGIPKPEIPGDDGQSPELELAANRSLVLMQAFLDEVKFNEKATEVVLIKRRQA